MIKNYVNWHHNCKFENAMNAIILLIMLMYDMFIVSKYAEWNAPLTSINWTVENKVNGILSYACILLTMRCEIDCAD